MSNTQSACGGQVLNEQVSKGNTTYTPPHNSEGSARDGLEHDKTVENMFSTRLRRAIPQISVQSVRFADAPDESPNAIRTGC